MLALKHYVASIISMLCFLIAVSSCGSSGAPLGTPARAVDPSATPAASAAPVSQRPAEPSSAPRMLPAATPSTVPSLADVPASPVPLNSVQYLLPAYFPDGYEILDAQLATAPEAGFVLSLHPVGADLPPEDRIMIAGGAPAKEAVENNVVDPNAGGALIEPITVRGQAGTIATGGFGYTIAWIEQGQPYMVMGGNNRDSLVAVINTLESVPLDTWQQRVAAPNKQPDPSS